MNTTQNEMVDVIIVGAGASGMAAAAQLTRGGLSVLMLEARETPGGRVLTRTDPHSGHTVELGAEFIHGKPQELWELLAAHPAPTYEGSGDDWCVEKGRICDCEFWEDVQTLLEKMRDCREPDRSFADFLRECGRDAGEAVRRHALQYVTGFNAADAERISVQSLLFQQDAEEKIEGDRVFRVRGGYQPLVFSLLDDVDRERFELRTSTVVKRARWRRGEVQVEAQSNGSTATFTARRALFTIPLGVWLAPPGAEGAIEFDPPLASKREALSQLAAGEVIRVTLSFASRFWESIRAEDRTLAGMHFLFTDHELFPTWWTLAPDDAPILTGWSPAASARQLSGLPETEIVERALQSLATILNLDPERLSMEVRSGFVHDWQSDPFSRGAYSYVCTGGAGAPQRLAEPLDGTLYFAGEATDVSGHIGTVHGAIASGRRAADEILGSG
jgi:monoamine oxidase